VLARAGLAGKMEGAYEIKIAIMMRLLSDMAFPFI